MKTSLLNLDIRCFLCFMVLVTGITQISFSLQTGMYLDLCRYIIVMVL